MEEIIAAICSAALIPIAKKIMAGKLLNDREYVVSSVLFFPIWLFLVNYCLNLYHEAREAEGVERWPDWVYALWNPGERALAPFVDALLLYPVLLMAVRLLCCGPKGPTLERARWIQRESLSFFKVIWIANILLCFYVFVTKLVF